MSKSILLRVDGSKTSGSVADSVDPDQMLHSQASDLDLHYLLRFVGPNTSGKYGNVLGQRFSSLYR